MLPACDYCELSQEGQRDVTEVIKWAPPITAVSLNEAHHTSSRLTARFNMSAVREAALTQT